MSKTTEKIKSLLSQCTIDELKEIYTDTGVVLLDKISQRQKEIKDEHDSLEKGKIIIQGK